MCKRLSVALIVLALWATPSFAAFADLVAVSKVWDGTGGATGATAAIDTSTAKLIVIGMAGGGSAIGAPTDSKSNTWTALTNYNNGNSEAPVRLYYCRPCVVGASHTFTPPAGQSITVAAFTAATSMGAFDQQTGDLVTPVGSTIQPGSITASELFVTVAAWRGSARTSSIDSSFNEQAGGETLENAGLFSPSISIATKIHGGGASAENPTWTFSTFENNGVAMATFTEDSTVLARPCCLGVF